MSTTTQVSVRLSVGSETTPDLFTGENGDVLIGVKTSDYCGHASLWAESGDEMVSFCLKVIDLLRPTLPLHAPPTEGDYHLAEVLVRRFEDSRSTATENGEVSLQTLKDWGS